MCQTAPHYLLTYCTRPVLLDHTQTNNNAMCQTAPHYLLTYCTRPVLLDNTQTNNNAMCQTAPYYLLTYCTRPVLLDNTQTNNSPVHCGRHTRHRILAQNTTKYKHKVWCCQFDCVTVCTSNGTDQLMPNTCFPLRHSDYCSK